MNATQYIISGLRTFIEKFPQTKVSYEFDAYAITHYIEIIPNEIYHLDEDYIAWEKSFFQNFIDQYPDQNICFINDDAPIRLEDVSFELTGKMYNTTISSHKADISISDVKYNIREVTSLSSVISYTSSSAKNIVLPEFLNAESNSKNTYSIQEAFGNLIDIKGRDIPKAA